VGGEMGGQMGGSSGLEIGASVLGSCLSRTGLVARESLANPCPDPTNSPQFSGVSAGSNRSLMNSRQFAGVSAGSNADVRSLPPAKVARASILAAGLWALQTRSWRRPELHMKTTRFNSTNRASRIGGTTRQEHRAGE
jgi:hypothetical protein